MRIIEFIKSIILGIIEGITEWLPISSTGHLILLEEILPLNVSEEFFEMFEVVIQLGASLAVLGLYLGTLLPNFKTLKTKNFLTAPENKRTFTLWGKIIVAVIPSAVIGLLLDDWFDAHFYNAPTVAAALAFYRIAIRNAVDSQGTTSFKAGDVTVSRSPAAAASSCPPPLLRKRPARRSSVLTPTRLWIPRPSSLLP